MVKIDDTARGSGSVRCPHRVERTFEPSECGSPFGEISEVGGGDGYNFGGGSSSSGGYGGGDEFEFGFETGTREGPIPEFDPQAFENPVASPGDMLFDGEGGSGSGGGGGDGSEVDATAGLFDGAGDTSGGLFGGGDEEIDPTAGLF